MKKRTSKDKQIKTTVERLKTQKQDKNSSKFTPLRTLEILLSYTSCLKLIRQFEKSRMDNILERKTIQQLRFRQFVTTFQEYEYMRKAYSINDIKHIFTDLIRISSKKQYQLFLTTNSFLAIRKNRVQKKMFETGRKIKDEVVNQTATRSFSQKRQQNKNIKDVLPQNQRPNISRKINHNSSETDIQYIVKGIQKMIKDCHSKQPESPQIQVKNSQPNHGMNIPDISRIQIDRVHTTPELMKCDHYGLGQYLIPNIMRSKGTQNISRSSKTHHKNENQKAIVRFHTQYDTSYIVQPKKTKSKSKQNMSSLSKKSFSKKKIFDKAKSPVGFTRISMKLKK